MHWLKWSAIHFITSAGNRNIAKIAAPCRTATHISQRTVGRTLTSDARTIVRQWTAKHPCVYIANFGMHCSQIGATYPLLNFAYKVFKVPKMDHQVDMQPPRFFAPNHSDPISLQCRGRRERLEILFVLSVLSFFDL